MTRILTPLIAILMLAFIVALRAAAQHDQPQHVVSEQGLSPLKSSSKTIEAGNKALVKGQLPVKGMRDPGEWSFPSTAFEYAKMVEAELGVLPRIDLSQAEEIPLFVKGVLTFGYLHQACDNPSLLGKDTVSGATLQRYEGRTADGTPLPDVVWVSFGRNSTGCSPPGAQVLRRFRRSLFPILAGLPLHCYHA